MLKQDVWRQVDMEIDSAHRPPSRVGWTIREHDARGILGARHVPGRQRSERAVLPVKIGLTIEVRVARAEH